jgi:hypothetical protein
MKVNIEWGSRILPYMRLSREMVKLSGEVVDFPMKEGLSGEVSQHESE